MEKYKFRKPSKKYSKHFAKEKKRLVKILPTAKIEQIGSTSVKNLGGKGIIDILVGIKKADIKSTINKLIKSGYNYKKHAGSKSRLFFEKNYGIIKKRRIHLQLTTYNSKIWKDSIKFRDILRSNKKIREEYSKIKQNAVKLKKKNKEYRKYKDKFIKEVIK